MDWGANTLNIFDHLGQVLRVWQASLRKIRNEIYRAVLAVETKSLRIQDVFGTTDSQSALGNGWYIHASVSYFLVNRYR